MSDKLLVLHHELLYPAFAGAALFEFADNVARHGYSKPDLLWAATAVWFLFYFCIAFLALAEANVAGRERKFGVLSFAANLAEIIIILAVSVSLVPDANAPRQIDYNFVYWGWVWLPITGGVSNFCSDRPVRTAISVCAIVIGLCWRYFAPVTAYPGALVLMYLLMLVYIISVFGRCRLNALCLDIDSAYWNDAIRNKLGFAPSPP